MTVLTCLEWANAQGANRKPKDKNLFSPVSKPPQQVFSHLFAHPPSLHQVKADRTVLVNPHFPGPICAADHQTGALLHDVKLHC